MTRVNNIGALIKNLRGYPLRNEEVYKIVDLVNVRGNWTDQQIAEYFLRQRSRKTNTYNERKKIENYQMATVLSADPTDRNAMYSEAYAHNKFKSQTDKLLSMILKTLRMERLPYDDYGTTAIHASLDSNYSPQYRSDNLYKLYFELNDLVGINPNTIMVKPFLTNVIKAEVGSFQIYRNPVWNTSSTIRMAISEFSIKGAYIGSTTKFNFEFDTRVNANSLYLTPKPMFNAVRFDRPVSSITSMTLSFFDPFNPMPFLEETGIYTISTNDPLTSTLLFTGDFFNMDTGNITISGFTHSAELDAVVNGTYNTFDVIPPQNPGANSTIEVIYDAYGDNVDTTAFLTYRSVNTAYLYDAANSIEAWVDADGREGTLIAVVGEHRVGPESPILVTAAADALFVDLPNDYLVEDTADSTHFRFRVPSRSLAGVVDGSTINLDYDITVLVDAVNNPTDVNTFVTLTGPSANFNTSLVAISEVDDVDIAAAIGATARRVTLTQTGFKFPISGYHTADSDTHVVVTGNDVQTGVMVYSGTIGYDYMLIDFGQNMIMQDGDLIRLTMSPDGNPAVEETYHVKSAISSRLFEVYLTAPLAMNIAPTDGTFAYRPSAIFILSLPSSQDITNVTFSGPVHNFQTGDYANVSDVTSGNATFDNLINGSHQVTVLSSTSFYVTISGNFNSIDTTGSVFFANRRIVVPFLFTCLKTDIVDMSSEIVV